MIRIAVVDSKVQKAAGETVKVLGTHMGPVDLLYEAAKEKWQGTKASIWLTDTIGKIEDARSKVTSAEEMAEGMGSILPDPVVQWVEWEKARRVELEATGQDTANELVHRSVDPLVNAAFKPIVLHYADDGYLKSDRLTVKEVILPDFDSHKTTELAIVLEYRYTLPIPFFHKTITIRKKAVETAWIGAW
ncbi:hypothetical protein [Gorillibacterium massiliense]|uniref:hypothetical protein n=1 Tax=Gorillibacterium massiliense TaxID=1280390 RepID=UPI0012DC2B34|nr:hypothetical protein [Gorillibacterium massiliense]